MDTEGLLCEVFSKLPAKSILRFRALSKTCSNFTSENFFLKKHSEQLLFKDDPCFFIQQDQRWGKAELHSLFWNDEKKSFSDYGVPNSSLQFLYDTAKIVGSYNGLLVLKNTNQEDMGLLLCNPATQKFISIPKLTMDSSDHSTFGIHILLNTGATEFPDNYGVILVKPTEDWSPYSNFYMYIKGEAWKEMGRFNTGARNILYDTSVYCRGAIHFISDTFSYLTKASPDYKPYIVACEIDKIRSWRLKLPKEAIRNADDRTCNMRIFRWGKPSLASESSICLVRLKKSVFMVWVLDDYEMVSWTLVLKTRVRAMGLSDPDPVVCGFTVMNGDSLVFATDKRIYRLTLSNGRPRHPVKAEEISSHGLGGCPGRCSMYLYFTCYTNTLRPCGSKELPLTYAPINSLSSFGCELQEEQPKFSKSVYDFVCHFSVFFFILCFLFFCLVSVFFLFFYLQKKCLKCNV